MHSYIFRAHYYFWICRHWRWAKFSARHLSYILQFSLSYLWCSNDSRWNRRTTCHSFRSTRSALNSCVQEGRNARPRSDIRQTCNRSPDWINQRHCDGITTKPLVIPLFPSLNTTDGRSTGEEKILIDDDLVDVAPCSTTARIPW